MATIVRGVRDESVEKVKATLDAYEQSYPGSAANLYRQNSASVRIRIVDQRFADWSKGRRHDDVWKFIADRLDEDDLQEISMLLLLSPTEAGASFLNSEFEHPIPSRL